uniref:Uncharacterized protein n=2 Tax=Schizaphis graminum TaxID=13262 RepID=A0A2S2NTV9_SCHGA
MYEIISFGRLIMTFRLCLKSESNPIEKISHCCQTNVRSNKDNLFLSCLDKNLESSQKTDSYKCFEAFKNSYENIFGYDQNLDFYYSFDEHSIGRDTYKLFNTTTNLASHHYEFQGDNIKMFSEFFEAFKSEDITKVFKLYPTDINECYSFFTNANVQENILSDIFEGFESYNTFMKNTAAIVKYLQAIEGPLVNNAELYEIFLNEKISFEDYLELRQPVPLIHETLYPLYSIRLQKLGYIPLEKSLWNEVRSKKAGKRPVLEILKNN